MLCIGSERSGSDWISFFCFKVNPHTNCSSLHPALMHCIKLYSYEGSKQTPFVNSTCREIKSHFAKLALNDRKMSHKRMGGLNEKKDHYLYCLP